MDKASISEKLVHLRGEQSRENVAEALGISLSTLQMYENGQRIPRDETKIKIARYYKSNVEDIFFGS